MEIRHIDLGMLGEMGILHRHKNSLLEKVFIDDRTVPLWHQHPKNKSKTQMKLKTKNNQDKWDEMVARVKTGLRNRLDTVSWKNTIIHLFNMLLLNSYRQR